MCLLFVLCSGFVFGVFVCCVVVLYGLCVMFAFCFVDLMMCWFVLCFVLCVLCVCVVCVLCVCCVFVRCCGLCFVVCVLCVLLLCVVC